MPTLEDAILLALQAHWGQTDKANLPYITHPLRIMGRMQTQEEMIVAVLHDVVEDTDITLDDLRMNEFSAEIVTAVDALSRREDESYEAFIDRIALNPLAVRVKLGDLRDNMDLRRLPTVGEDDAERLDRYVKVWDKLTNLRK
jgi:(p)ppGpp synthase/HD superfamily hydrolase